MVWQEAFPPTGGPAFDAETERERRLAAQARAGAAWALTALIARYQPTVVRYLTRLSGNQAQAQRMAERIFQRMERRLHGPQGAENLRLWLLRACTEAGLDALRRPNARSAPRIGGSSVAGLLTPQSGASPQSMLRGGLHRLRKGGGGVERQARPLVWADTQPPVSSGANGATDPRDPERFTSEQHLDEALDRLDPRDALRHRLVRVTLAELPFGDAQCLALHLVAGLNQAEVARALGINSSAARRRIVHGLALFSDRYNQAVQSLGLPVELGYGDALPRAPMEPEPVAAPTPEPVVISAEAPTAAARDESDLAPASVAESDDELVAASAAQDERSRDILSGVSYLTEEADDDLDDEEIEEAPQPAALAADAAPISGGLITRVASDAIVGPIVDALPIEAASPESSGVFGLPGPRSMPLAYELSSHHTPGSPDTSEIRMHWLDDTGMMTPLSFEAVVAPSAVAATQSTDDDVPLSYEATAASMGVESAADASAPADEARLTFELTPIAAADAISPDQPAASGATSGAGLALDAGAAPLALVADPPPPPPVMVPVTTPGQAPRLTPRLLAEAEAQAAAAGADTRIAPTERAERDTAERTDTTVAFAPRSLGGAITRSLEDLWEEAPDGADF
ncbi:MAG: RNA polymerase sigma factor [Ktedonobacterales bacterium]